MYKLLETHRSHGVSVSLSKSESETTREQFSVHISCGVMVWWLGCITSNQKVVV